MIKNTLRIILLAVLIWVGVEAALTVRSARSVEAQLYDLRIAEVRQNFDAKIQAITVPDVQPTLDAATAALNAAKAKIDALAVPDVQPVLDAAKAKIDSVKVPDVQPTLDATNADLKDAKDIIDSWYDDATALLESAAVTTAQVGQMSQTINKSMPQLTAQAVEGEKQLAGIATDVHVVTTQIAKPKSFFGKVWEGAKGLAGLARLL